MDFKFAVGDFVVLAGSLKAAEVFPRDRKRDFLSNRKPFVLHILERYSQECPGGVQRHYLCRMVHEEGYGLDYVRFNEIELVAISEIPAVAKENAPEG